MASGTGHLMGGLATWLACTYIFHVKIDSPLLYGVTLGCVLAGSLLPDIDVQSKGRKLFYGLMAPAYLLLFAKGKLVLCFLVGLCAILPVLSTHRGIFHRWWFLLTLSSLWGLAVVSMFPRYADLGLLGTVYFLLGCLSHLVLDYGVFGFLFK
jgi:hypothetical protein